MPPWRRPNAWLSRQLNGILRYDFEYKEIPLASAARKFREKHKVNITVAEIEHCVRDSLRQGEPYFEYLAGDPATIAAALEPGWKRRYENHGDDDDDWEDYWGNWRQWGNSKEGGGSSGDGGTKTMQAKKEEQQVKKDDGDDDVEAESKLCVDQLKERIRKAESVEDIAKVESVIKTGVRRGGRLGFLLKQAFPSFKQEDDDEEDNWGQWGGSRPLPESLGRSVKEEAGGRSVKKEAEEQSRRAQKVSEEAGGRSVKNEEQQVKKDEKDDGGTKTMQAKKEEQQVKKDEKDDAGTKPMQAKKEDQQVKKDEDELQVKNEDGAKREEPSSSPPNSPPHDEHATTAKNCPPCPAYDSWEAPPVAALRPPPPPPPRQRSWVISEPPPAKHPGPKVMWARPPPNTWARPPPSVIDLG